ncbi:unnamed protein product [Discosporangium mesarthrocarpum]
MSGDRRLGGTGVLSRDGGSPSGSKSPPAGLPEGFFDTQEHEEEVDAKEGSKAGQGLDLSSGNSGPPRDFFDEDGGHQSRVGGSGGMRDHTELMRGVEPPGSSTPVANDAEGQEGEGGGKGSPNGSALPEGFFDDPEVDAKSRGVDLKARKKQAEMNDWKAFQEFAGEIRQNEQEEQKREDAAEVEKEHYEELEQATMMGRLAALMKKSETIGRNRRRGHPAPGKVREKAEVEPGRGGAQEDGDLERSVIEAGLAMRAVAVAIAPADHAAGEISAMLRKRKRERKQELDEAFAGEYVPMDPLDWRAKGV